MHCVVAGERRSARLSQAHVRVGFLHHLLAGHLHAVGEVFLILQDGKEFVGDGVKFVLIFEEFGDDGNGGEAVFPRGLATFGIEDAGTNDGREVL